MSTSRFFTGACALVIFLAGCTSSGSVTVTPTPSMSTSATLPPTMPPTNAPMSTPTTSDSAEPVFSSPSPASNPSDTPVTMAPTNPAPTPVPPTALPTLMPTIAPTANPTTSTTPTIAPATATPVSASSMITPISSQAFYDTIGINVHLSYPIYADNYATFRDRLLLLGLRHLRDGMLSTDNAGYYSKLADLATQGIRGTLITSPTETTSFLEAGVQAASGFVEAIEAPNEYDLNGGANWRDPLVQYQAALYSGVKASPILKNLPVLGPSLVRAESYAAVGDISSILDYGNMHNYFAGYPPGSSGWGGGGFGSAYGSIVYNLGSTAQSSGLKPVITTETGYCTLPGVRNTTPPNIHARYVPRMFLEQYLHGVARTIEYEMVDEGGAGCDSNLGLLYADFSPKTGFYALANLVGQLDRDQAPQSLNPIPLTITAAADTVHHLLLANADGTYTLALWNEVASYDVNAGTSGAPIVTAPVPTTLMLQASPLSGVASVIGDDGMLAPVPMTWLAGSTTIPVDDHVTLIRFSTSGAAIRMPSGVRRASPRPTATAKPVAVIPTPLPTGPFRWGVSFGEFDGDVAAKWTPAQWATAKKYIDVDDRQAGKNVAAAHQVGMLSGYYGDPNQACTATSNVNCWWWNIASGYSASSFARDCQGNQLYTGDPSDGHNTLMNPASPSLANDWNRLYADGVKSAGYDFIFEDNVFTRTNANEYTGKPGGTPMPSGPAWCGYTDDGYIAAQTAFQRAIHVPVQFNGDTGPKLAAIAQSGNTFAGMCEDCLSFGYSQASDPNRRFERPPYWQQELSAGLLTEQQGTKWFPFLHGYDEPKTNDVQNYVLASLMLIYQDGLTGWQMDGYTTSGINVPVGITLVPTLPDKPTAGLSLEMLDFGGIYAREFGACYIKGKLVWACAALVNPDPSAAHAMPQLRRLYTSIIATDNWCGTATVTNLQGDYCYKSAVSEWGDTGGLYIASATPPHVGDMIPPATAVIVSQAPPLAGARFTPGLLRKHAQLRTNRK